MSYIFKNETVCGVLGSTHSALLNTKLDVIRLLISYDLIWPQEKDLTK